MDGSKEKSKSSMDFYSRNLAGFESPPGFDPGAGMAGFEESGGYDPGVTMAGCEMRFPAAGRTGIPYLG